MTSSNSALPGARQLVLASSSRYRRDLLERLRVPFSCHSPDIDETPSPGESAVELVNRVLALHGFDVPAAVSAQAQPVRH